MRRSCASPPRKKWWYGSHSRYSPPISFTQAQLDQVRRKHRRDDAEDEGADDAVAQRLPLLLLGQAQHEDGQHHGVVGAEQAFEHDEQRDGDEIGRDEV